MKTARFMAMTSGMTLVLSGCMLDLLVTSAVSGEAAKQDATETKIAMTEAKIDLDVGLLKQAVQQYQAEKGTWPRDLQELAPAYIEAVPERPDGKPYGYNPLTGEVFKNGDGPAPADYFTMESLRAAIVSYGRSTGYYPDSLDALYPHYIASLPRTESGEQFIYDSQNGRVRHPAELTQQASGSADPPPASAPVRPANAVGSLNEGDLKDSKQLNKALDRIGY